MSNLKQMLQLPTSRIQQLAALALVAVLGSSLAIAASTIGRGTAPATVSDHSSSAVIASGAGKQPSAALQKTSGLTRVPYEAGWQLYDGGWAGGPNTLRAASGQSGMVRVPYEAGWQLYDGGWAGGPRTAQ